jgi:glycosyltransferase involved in cell wall biosynthesis
MIDSIKTATRYFIASGCPIATTTLYRCVHLQEQLRALGHDAVVVDWFHEAKIDPTEALTYDVIVLYRLPMSPALEGLISQARQLNKPVIFDTDDLIFEPELTLWHRAVKTLSPADQAQHLEGVRRYLVTLLASDAVTVATPFLADLAAKRGKAAFVHRNSLGNEMLELADELYGKRTPRILDSKVVVGYGSGTATHDVDFLEVAASLGTVLEEFPQVEVWIAGPLTLPSTFDRFANRVRRYPLSDWQNWLRLMAQMDIVLAPLEAGNVFCRAKSEIKFVEAGVLGLPVVASDIDPYRDSIAHERNGFLASDEKEWTAALRSLIESAQLRTTIGDAARQTVLNNYSPGARTADLNNLLVAFGKRLKPSQIFEDLSC